MALSLFTPNAPIGSLLAGAAPAYQTPPPVAPSIQTTAFQRNTPEKQQFDFGPTMDQAAVLASAPWAADGSTAPQKMQFSFGDTTGLPPGKFGFGPIADAALARNQGIGQTSGQTGSSVSLGGDWSGVDQWTSSINSAAQQTGVDPDALKALMREESNGDPGATGSAGVGGLMQINANAWGGGAWQTDNNANILKGAQILKQYLDENGGDLYQALRHYHGIGFDGNTTDTQYADIVMGFYNQLKAGGGTTGVGATGSSAGLQGMFGPSAGVPDWGAFNVASSNGLYGYGVDYGLNGVNHTGEDIPLPYGSQMRTPFSGRVVCSGTGIGDGTDSCAAFQDAIGGGAGRIEILSDDGNTVLIFGHSSRAAVPAGTHINAGDVIGWSGGENSEHVHLEARVRDNSTPSGWRIVDPATVIGGGGISSGVAARFANAGQRTVGINPLRDFLERQQLT